MVMFLGSLMSNQGDENAFRYGVFGGKKLISHNPLLIKRVCAPSLARQVDLGFCQSHLTDGDM